MSAIAAEEHTARKWVVECEDREARRAGLPLPHARASLSRKIGIPAGTLENIRRGRSKGVRSWVLNVLREFVARELEAEIARLTHELAMVRARTGGAESNAEGAARAAIEAARRLVLEARQ